MICFQSYSMSGSKNSFHNSVARRCYFSFFGNNGNSLSQNLCCKGFIFYFTHRNGLALHMTVQKNFSRYGFLDFQFFSLSFFSLSFFLFRFLTGFGNRILISKHPCKNKSHSYGNRHHQKIRQRLIQTKKNTENTGNSCSGCPQSCYRGK